MPVHQVETYYISCVICNGSKDGIRELLENEAIDDFEFQDEHIIVDGFDCEDEAKEIESKIIAIDNK